MKKEIVISGFGGQGGLAIGKNLAEAGMAEGLNVTWAPSYGPEMRGGTANCSVVLSDKPVGSPVFAHPTELIALNEPSLVKFEEGVIPGGMVFVNSDVVTDKVSRTDLTAYYIPCSQIADEVGNPKVSNMVMLGAYVAGTKVLKAETIEKMIQEMFTGAKAKFVPLNIEAFRRGINNTIGICFSVLLVGAVRELLAEGTVFGNVVFPVAPLPLADQPGTGFIIIGLIAAVWTAIGGAYVHYKIEEVRHLYGNKRKR